MCKIRRLKMVKFGVSVGAFLLEEAACIDLFLVVPLLKVDVI